MTRKINIAIDGHSSCGKGTLSKYLASELGYHFIDTGAMYRALTLHAIRLEVDADDADAVESLLPGVQLDLHWNQEKGRSEIILNGENVEREIRSLPVAEKVSQVARIPAVRRHLVALQQEMCKDKGVVMDGRDIGTVVIPGAELKIFMTASTEVRAQRRLIELLGQGQTAEYQDVLANLENRDRIDSQRADSPLKYEADYRLLDNSTLTIPEQNTLAMSWVREALR